MYLQQLQQQSKAGRQNCHELSSTFLPGQTQMMWPGQGKEKRFSFGSWCQSQIRFVLGFFFFPSVLFSQVVFKAEESAYLEALPTACIKSWHAEQCADAINSHHRLTDPAPFCCMGFCLYPQRLCCRQLSLIIQGMPKDNSYLFFPRLLHPLLTLEGEKKTTPIEQSFVFLFIISYSSFCCSNRRCDDSKHSHSRPERQLQEVKNRQSCPSKKTSSDLKTFLLRCLL